MAPERSTTVFNALRNEKDPPKRSEQKGVYKIPVEDLDSNKKLAYVGVTSRKLSKRLEEHKKDIEQARTTTALAQEAYSKNVNILWDEAKVIRNVPRRTQPVITESLEIIRRRTKEDLINDRLAWEPSDVWKYALYKESLNQ